MNARVVSLFIFGLCISIHGNTVGQVPYIRWFELGVGFQATGSTDIGLKSAIGQMFVGTTTQAGLRVSSGFLVDSLLRGSTTGVEEPAKRPTEFALHQNFPNPFNPTTTIRYSISERTHVSLRLFNLLGQEVMVLIDEDQDRGEHSVHLNASLLASGVYFYRMAAGQFSDQRKIILLK